MPWERKREREKKLVEDGSPRTKLSFFPSCFLVVAPTRIYINSFICRHPRGKAAHYGAAAAARHRNAVVAVACAGNYQNTEAVIFRKCIQRALHMNEPMNKNDVVLVSDLCRGGRNGRGGRRVAAAAVWNKRSGWGSVHEGSGHNYSERRQLDGWAQKCI